MNKRRFFSVVWRINAIVIFIVGVLGALLLAAGTYSVFEGIVRKATRAKPAEVAASATSQESDKDFRLGAFERVQGTHVLRAAYEEGPAEDGESSYGKKSESSVRNFLYLDTSTRSTYWLKPSTTGIIVHHQSLSDDRGKVVHDDEDPPGPEIASVYVSVEKDSDGDGQLTEIDKQRIAVSDAKGREYRVVADGVDKLEQALLLGPDRLLILYSVGQKLKAAELNPLQKASAIETYEVQKSLKKAGTPPSKGS